MIKTLSPYYLSIPFVSPLTGLTCTNFTLQVFVWSGLKGSPPALSTWEITKKNPTASTGNSRINISNIINDFIQFTPQEGTVTGLLDGNNQRWVKWRVFYTTTDPSDQIVPSNINTKLMVKGFNLGLEAENKETPTNKVLLNGREFKVSRSGIFVLPIEIDETTLVLGTLLISDIVTLPSDRYNIVFSQTGNLGLIRFRWAIPDGQWIYTTETTTVSPLNFLLNPPPSEYTFQIYAYDNVNETTIYSNIFTKTIV